MSLVIDSSDFVLTYDSFPCYSSEIFGADLVCSSLTLAMEHVSSPPLSDKIENVLILGGAEVYKVSQLSIIQ